MINVIKTAIITIIISIISGLLLEYFKNIAPRILCSIGKGIPIKISNRKVYAYNIIVSNLSRKIIHELTLSIQGSQSDLKIADAKITKGLKFDSSIKNNSLDISIPFLSKGDEFSVTVYAERHNRPVIVMRSPENFKEVNSIEQKEIQSSLFDRSKNINAGSRKTSNRADGLNKKAIAIGTSLVVVLMIAGLAKLYLKEKPINTKTPSTEINANKQPANRQGSIGGTTEGNRRVDTSKVRTTQNSNSNTSKDGNDESTSTKTSTDGTAGDTKGVPGTDTKASGGTSGENSGAKTQAGGKTQNTGTNTSSGGTSGGADSNNTSTGGAAGNTGTDSSAGSPAGSGGTATGGTSQGNGK